MGSGSFLNGNKNIDCKFNSNLTLSPYPYFWIMSLGRRVTKTMVSKLVCGTPQTGTVKIKSAKVVCLYGVYTREKRWALLLKNRRCSYENLKKIPAEKSEEKSRTLSNK